MTRLSNMPVAPSLRYFSQLSLVSISRLLQMDQKKMGGWNWLRKDSKPIEIFFLTWNNLILPVEVMEFQLRYLKSWKMTLWKCCSQYDSKFGKLSSGHSKRSYPASEVRGGQEEPPQVPSQGQQPGGATPCPRPGMVARRSNPTSKERWLCGRRRA